MLFGRAALHPRSPANPIYRCCWYLYTSDKPIHVEPESRWVKGLTDVFAVGDVADYPIKQVFLALLQGDAAADHYRVGVSPIWRVGKKVLGIYAPWRFTSGEPFLAGLAWDALDLGLKVMSKFLAH